MEGGGGSGGGVAEFIGEAQKYMKPAAIVLAKLSTETRDPGDVGSFRGLFKKIMQHGP